MWRARLCIVVSAILVCLATPGAEPIVFYEDGSVGGCFPTVPGEAVFRFGLPAGKALKSWREGGALRRLWVKDGVQYTQTVLTTPFAAGPNKGNPTAADRFVLVIQVEGVNTNADYTEATAELELETGRSTRPIELKGGLLRYGNPPEQERVLGAFEIPESGVKVSKGRKLRFQGNMPPSINGSMTLKLPLFKLDQVEGAAEALIDLLFEEEFRRAVKGGAAAGFAGLVFAEEQPGAPAVSTATSVIPAPVQVVPRWIPKAPVLPPAQGNTIHVQTVEELMTAVESVGPGETINIADGHYRVLRPMVLAAKTNVIIRSVSGDPARVTLTGRGWDSADGGDDLLHIGRCSGITVAGLAFADCRSYGIKVEAESAPADIHIQNCHFKDIGVRAIKGSAGTDPGIRAVGGAVRFCRFENTRVPPANWLFGGDYIAGIDMMALEGWTFSDNVFRNIKGRNGGARAAIFIWVRSRKVTVERNVIVDCDRGIAFGNPSQSTANRPGEELTYVAEGVIRNNMISGGPDCGIELWHVDGLRVLHNSIWRPERNWRRGIRIGAGTRRTEVRNNLVHGDILQEGGEAMVEGNVSGRLEGYFADPGVGDLALTPMAVRAIDAAAPVPQFLEDIVRKQRGDKPDVGAWEFSAR